ncbi:hypothetical protein K458DRAFT_422108 [Lentithecium fluviatile CBS 122367]|uniref:BZIP domain-containing protein n=1 Tax=Lentithecium fluviatile CBS 122367 TaxID=1168545 RepID=A0A6G1IMS7_9PLEO|nr:hypothetical protein K458DRAFT_422108 [Lentithecium fluviatile CBS 122367]
MLGLMPLLSAVHAAKLSKDGWSCVNYFHKRRMGLQLLAMDAQQRKRMQNRQAQRTYRKLRKSVAKNAIFVD